MSFFFFQIYFLLVIGLVDLEKLSLGDIVVRYRYLFLENIEVLIFLYFILKIGYVVFLLDCLVFYFILFKGVNKDFYLIFEILL